MPMSVSPGSSTAKASHSSSNTNDKSPAFHGASRAFNANPTAPANASNGAHGARAAASFVGGGGRGQQIQNYGNDGLSPLSRQATGQSLRSRDPSPSHVAANLAASQALSRPSHAPESSHAHPKKLRRPEHLQKVPTGPSHTDGQSEELLESPATKSLVQLYEFKQNPSLQKTQSVRYVSKPGPPIWSPKPVRPLARSVSSASDLSNKVQAPLVGTRPNVGQEETKVSRHGAAVPAAKMPADSAFPMEDRVQGARVAERKPSRVLPPRKKGLHLEEDVDAKTRPKPTRTKSSAASVALVDGGPRDQVDKLSRETKSMARVYPHSQPSSSSDSKGPSPPNRPPHLPARLPLPSAKSYDKTTPPPPPPPLPRQTSRDHTRHLSTHMSIDSLANAMVASSLASSRVPSPTKSLPNPRPPPPPPRRHHGHHFFHRNPPSEDLLSRTPSPSKPTLRHTMRRHPSSSSSSSGGHHKRRHLVRKHQHKHHEGDRKRYRTQITERERKRYEGVWAANRGVLFGSLAATSLTSNAEGTGIGTGTGTADADAVLNTVVKDIWRRSRLPDDVLAEVWDLVAEGDSGEKNAAKGKDRLNREEFVVGLWLIDQRLKGNKLPVKVSESVWDSVRRLVGITVPRKRY